MKSTIATVITVLACLSASAAFAQSPPSTGLTRAQVREQLVQAERDGIIPTTDADYPPSDEEIARNKAVYQLQFGKSDAPQQWAQDGH
jgi:acyl-coenzyme A synthetase/AMP-(fatty) acid ligase